MPVMMLSSVDYPLRPAEDAIIIVTDQLEINEVLDKILNIVEGRR